MEMDHIIEFEVMLYINLTTSNATGIYHLQTYLTFQAGDILGFYQPSDSQLRLWLAVRLDPLQTVYLRSGNPHTEFATSASSSIRMQNLLVSVETGKFLVYVILISVPKQYIFLHV